MKALITAPFAESELEKLRDAGLTIDYLSWLETGKLYLGDKMLDIIGRGGYEIVVVEGDELKEDVITGSDLKLIASVRGSPNNISVPAATQKGIPVIAASGRNTIAVAELTLALMLAHARRIIVSERLLQNEFMVDDFADFAGMYKTTMGLELHGKTIGIIGLGKIGHEVAKRLKAFGVRLLVYDPYVSGELAHELDARIVELNELLEESDIVTVHCAATDETRGLIGEEQFAMMKHTSLFINTARASITDEQALFKALKEGRIAGAGLDVFSMEPVDCDNVFLELDNVTVTPHIGGNTKETLQRHSEIIAEAILDFLQGKIPRNILNPEVLKRGES